MLITLTRFANFAMAFAGVFALVNVFPGNAMAATPVFEGLPWGATEVDIRDAFGARVRMSPCIDKKHEEQAARPDARKCGSPVVEDYEIDGIVFLAFFNLNGPKNTLSAVYLDRVATVTNDQIKRNEGAELRYNRVKEVLEKRYGKPTEANETKERSMRKPAILQSKWIVDGTVISLTDTIVSEARGQMYYLSVVYKPLSDAVKPLVR